MAIIHVERIGTANPGVIRADGKNTYKETYFIRTDDNKDGPITVSSAVGLPTLRSPYITPNEFDLRARCKSVTPTQRGPYAWELTFDYDTEVEEEENPLDRPVKWSMSFAAYTRIAEKDIEGEIVENSAGMKFNPPIEIDDNRPIIQAIRNEAFYDPARARRFQNAINSRPWKGLPPRTVLCMPFPSGDEQEENGITFYPVSYQFQLSEEGQTWEFEVLDAGFYEKIGSDDPSGVNPVFSDLEFKSALMVITDEDGNAFQEPVKLDGNGRRLKPGKDPVYKKWRLLKERDLNDLGL